MKSPSNSLDEILDTGRKSQIFAKSTRNSNDIRKTASGASCESESVQVLLVMNLRGIAYCSTPVYSLVQGWAKF